MSSLLQPHQKVTLETTGTLCEVEDFLGGGGQGEVYRVNAAGSQLALKWYFSQSATPQQRSSLDKLVMRGAPNPNFLWPQELASASGTAGFGYVMKLRESRYKSIIDLMKNRIDPSYRELITAAYHLADSFFQLHNRGFCYRDISFGNVFFDPATGDILICDNDNVTIDGEPASGIMGTPRFMAPEIVRGEVAPDGSPIAPSIQTDLFSLAVLLFYMFMVAHPLDGKREAAIKSFDLPAMTRLYGTDPLFIFHPSDDSNAPVKGYHDNAFTFWPIYPKAFRDLFVRSFVDGIKDPQNGRVRESEWRAGLVRLRDSIVYCDGCATENFYDIDSMKASGGKTPECWFCHREIILPFRIRIGSSNVVMLNHDTRLFPHHLGQALHDFSKPLAEVTRHPKTPSIRGLKNLSFEKWVAICADGSIKDVEPGRSITLAAGTKIQFGMVEGDIRI